MCGACEDEVFLTTPNPHCVLRGLAPAPAVKPRSRFAATAVDDDTPPGPLAAALPPLLSLSRGRAAGTLAART